MKSIVKPGFLIAWASLAVLLGSALPVCAGEVLDRIAATVNGHAILQSDWEDAVRVEAFASGRSRLELSAEDRKAALDRLIDQELLREQMRSADFEHASEAEIAGRIAEIRKHYAEASTEAGWQAKLALSSLTEDELKNWVRLELDEMKLVDARLRPAVDVDSKSIESYYNQQFLPQLHQAGGQELPLADVTPEIKELLTQQKMNKLLSAWLQNLRALSEIRTQPVSSPASGPEQ
jgi:hypothetical protein